MGEAEEIRSELLYYTIVTAIVSLGKGGGLAIGVLMHGHPPERIRASVEEESPLRIHLYRTVAHFGLGNVHHPLALEQLDPHRVEVRIFHSVP